MDPCKGLQPCSTKQPFSKGWAGTDLDMGVTRGGLALGPAGAVAPAGP
jgi:hypothetical protein